MSYTKNTWQTGDIITADKLNNIENGIAASGGGGGLAVVHSLSTDELDKTWKEIHDALVAGSSVTMKEDSSSETFAVGMVIDAVYDSYKQRPYQIEAYMWTGSRFSIELFNSDTENGTLMRVGD